MFKDFEELVNKARMMKKKLTIVIAAADDETMIHADRNIK